MLRSRKRRAAAITAELERDALEIRNLLDAPELRAVLGDAAFTEPAAPVELDWGRPGRVHRPRFGRRVLLKAA